MNRWRRIAWALLLTAALGGCAVRAAMPSSIAEGAALPDASPTVQEMFTDRDRDPGYDGRACISITLNGDSASATSDSVRISGTTISLTEEATYVISGTLNDGTILVDAPDDAKLQLVLSGASVHSEDSAALYVRSADKVFVTLAEGTENALSSGSAFRDDADGAIFSRQDLTLNGAGSLAAISPAGHGIVCKDDLAIFGGVYDIDAAGHGLDANDSIRVAGGASLRIAAGKDGLHAENPDDSSLGFAFLSDSEMDIASEGDGISAGSNLWIARGTFRIVSGGGSEQGRRASADPDGADDDRPSAKGLKAGDGLTVSGGTLSIDSADDSVHSDGSMTIAGGSMQIATADNGLHAEENLTVVDGVLSISESYEGMEALHVVVQGGEISLVADDDGLNAAGEEAASDASIAISGGRLSIRAGGDGIDANGSVEISGGMISIVGPAHGDTSTLDYDTRATITGGTIIGTGASRMAKTFSDSTQGVLSATLQEQAAGTTVRILDADGRTLITCSPELPFDALLFSSPEVVPGSTYIVLAGTVQFEWTAE